MRYLIIVLTILLSSQQSFATYAGEKEIALIAAASRGDSREIEALLHLGADIHALKAFDLNRFFVVADYALEAAAEARSLESVRILLGAKPRLQDLLFCRALRKAIEFQNVELVKIFLDYGFHPDGWSEFSNTSFGVGSLAFFEVPKSFAAVDCKQIRFSDVGWTDISATTAVASILLERLGYQTKMTQLSVPVTYVSLKNKDLDVFLGNWMPSMTADSEPFLKEGSVENLGILLQGARYSLAVPRYVYEAGVHSVADLEKYREKLGGKNLRY